MDIKKVSIATKSSNVSRAIATILNMVGVISTVDDEREALAVGHRGEISLHDSSRAEICVVTRPDHMGALDADDLKRLLELQRDLARSLNHRGHLTIEEVEILLKHYRFDCFAVAREFAQGTYNTLSMGERDRLRYQNHFGCYEGTKRLQYQNHLGHHRDVSVSDIVRAALLSCREARFYGY